MAPCNHSGDCAIGRVCALGGCRTAYGFTTGQNSIPGQPCQCDVECGTAERCHQKKCEFVRTDTVCRHTFDCGNGHRCVNTRCVLTPDGSDCQQPPRSGTHRGTDHHCGKNQMCGLKCNSFFGPIEKSLVPCGTPCLTTDTCGAYQVCRENICSSIPRSSACTSSADCGIRGICLPNSGRPGSECQAARDDWWCEHDKHCGLGQVCAKGRCVSVSQPCHCDATGGAPFIISAQPTMCLHQITDDSKRAQFAQKYPVVMAYIDKPNDFRATQALTQFCHSRALRLANETASSKPPGVSFLQMKETAPRAPSPTAWLSAAHATPSGTHTANVLSVTGISRRHNEFVAADGAYELPTLVTSEYILGKALKLGPTQKLVYTARSPASSNQYGTATQPHLSLFVLFKAQYSQPGEAADTGSCVASVFLASSNTPHVSVCAGPAGIRIDTNSKQFAVRSASHLSDQWVLVSVTTNHSMSARVPDVYLYTERSGWKEIKAPLELVTSQARLSRPGIGITFKKRHLRTAFRCFGSLCETALRVAGSARSKSSEPQSAPPFDPLASIIVGGCPVGNCAYSEKGSRVLVHDVVLFENFLSPAQRQRTGTNLLRDLIRVYHSHAKHNTMQQLLWERNAITDMLRNNKSIPAFQANSVLRDMTLPDVSDLLTATISQMNNRTTGAGKMALAKSNRFRKVRQSRIADMELSIKHTLSCICSSSHSPRDKSCISVAEPGSKCNRDDHCSTRQHCLNGFCVLKLDLVSCNTTDQCANAQICRSRACFLLPEGAICSHTAECGHRQSCLDRRCTALYGTGKLARQLDASLEAMRGHIAALNMSFDKKKQDAQNEFQKVMDQLRAEIDSQKKEIESEKLEHANRMAHRFEKQKQQGKELKHLLIELREKRARLRKDKQAKAAARLTQTQRALEVQ